MKKQEQKPQTSSQASSSTSSQKTLTKAVFDNELFAQLEYEEGLSEVLKYAYEGDLVNFQALIQEDNTLVSEEDDKGNIPLHYAVYGNQVEVVDYLIQQKAGMASKNIYELEPLHLAAYFGATESAALLLDQGAVGNTVKVQHQGFNLSCSPLHLAVLGEHIDTLEVIITALTKKRMLVKQLHVAGIGNILHLAVLMRDPGLLNFLAYHPCIVDIEKGDPYNEENSEHYTPLSLAARLGNIAAIKILSQHDKVRLHEVSTNKKQTILHIAAKAGYKEALDTTIASISQQRALDELLSKTDDIKEHRTARQLAEKRQLKYTSEAAIEKNTEIKKDKQKQVRRYRGIVHWFDTCNLQVAHRLYQQPLSQNLLIHNLVFQGGGPKGIAYVGALKAIEAMLKQRHSSFNEVRRVAGTSAGAITALLVALNLSIDELEAELSSLNLIDLIDDNVDISHLKGILEEVNCIVKGERSGTQATSFVLELVKKHYGCSNKLSAAAYVYRHKDKILADFMKLTGLCSGDKFKAWLQGVVARKLAKEGIDKKYGEDFITNLTFSKLAHLIKHDPRYKHLHLVTYRISQQPGLVEMSSEEDALKDWGNVNIIEAVRASMSIPGVFKPQVIRRQNEHGQLIEEQFVDGGILMNYPIKLFDRVKYLSRYLSGADDYELYNEETLGLRLVSQEEMTPKPQGKIDNPVELAKCLMSAFYEAEKVIAAFEKRNQYRSININDCGVGTLDFDLDEKGNLKLKQAGEEAVKAFFTQYNTLATKSNKKGKDKEVHHGFTSTPRSASFFASTPHTSEEKGKQKVEDDEISAAAIKALGNLTHPTLAQIDFLCERARQDKNGEIRTAAIKALSNLSHPTAAVLDLLCELAERGSVRQTYSS